MRIIAIQISNRCPAIKNTFSKIRDPLCHHFQKHRRTNISHLGTVHWSDGGTACCWKNVFAECLTLKATLKATMCKRVFTSSKKSSQAIYFSTESKGKVRKKNCSPNVKSQLVHSWIPMWCTWCHLMVEINICSHNRTRRELKGKDLCVCHTHWEPKAWPQPSSSAV